MTILRAQTAHTERAARVFGEEAIQIIHACSQQFYAPIPVIGGPTNYIAYRGDLFPTLSGGGFSSLSDLVTKASGGRQQIVTFLNKGTNTGSAGQYMSTWYVNGLPPTGTTPPAIPSGAVVSSGTTGVIGPQRDPASGETLHLISVQTWGVGSSNPNVLLLYDRLWHGMVALNTTSAQSITGVPSRYTGTAAVGNFAFIEVQTALANTAHNWTLAFVDDTGASQTAYVTSGIAAAAANQIDHTPWFIDLNNNTSNTVLGIRNATSITLSATLSSGAAALVIGHPLAFIPVPSQYIPTYVDGVISAFNLLQIQNGAALALLELKGSAGQNYSGSITLVAG